MSIMEATPLTEESQRRIKGDPELKRELRELCRTDNITNWFYIARAWGLIALSIAATVGTYYALAGTGWWMLLTIPVALMAIVVIGASQHQLAGATHEATHHTLFKNKLMNELASEWLCMYPVLSSTYTFRLYHLVHHQFINDPERDPDFVVLEKSGHWLDFPVPASQFINMMWKQLRIFPLVRYMLVRGKYNALGMEGAKAYQRSDDQGESKMAIRLSLAWLIGLLGMLVGLYYYGQPSLVLIIPPLYYLAMVAVLYFLPDSKFKSARLKPVIPLRYQAMSRLGFFLVVDVALTYGQMVTGVPLWWIYIGLWIVPILTTFSFFMILRQVVQHGNGDRGWLTNTRTFLVNPFVKYAVFPFGMDYHLPHHMYATVPHYRLPALHSFLSQFPEYKEEGIVVENYLRPVSKSPDRNPTVVEVLGPEYAKNTDDIFVDDSVLDGWEVDEKDEILSQGKPR